jgi:hypothetical protein
LDALRLFAPKKVMLAKGMSASLPT